MCGCDVGAIREGVVAVGSSDIALSKVVFSYSADTYMVRAFTEGTVLECIVRTWRIVGCWGLVDSSMVG